LPGLGQSSREYAEIFGSPRQSFRSPVEPIYGDGFRNRGLRRCRQCLRQIGTSLDTLGIYFERLLVVGNSLAHLSLLKKDDPEIIVNIGLVGFDLELVFAMSDSLIHLVLKEKSIPKIVMDFDEVWFEFERLVFDKLDKTGGHQRNSSHSSICHNNVTILGPYFSEAAAYSANCPGPWVKD
jgi:hypothetical protein